MAKSILDLTPSELGFSSKDNAELGISSKLPKPFLKKPFYPDDLGFSADEQAELGIKPVKIETPKPFEPSPADIKINMPKPVAPGPYGEDIARQQAREEENLRLYGERLPHGKDDVVRPAVAMGLNIASAVPKIPQTIGRWAQGNYAEWEKDLNAREAAAKTEEEIKTIAEERGRMQRNKAVFESAKGKAAPLVKPISNALSLKIQQAADAYASMPEQAADLRKQFETIAGSKPKLADDLINSAKLGKLDLQLDWFASQAAARGDQQSLEEMQKLSQDYRNAQSDYQKAGIVREALRGVARMAPGLVGSMAVSAIPVVGVPAAFTGWAAQGAGEVFNKAVEEGADPQKAAISAAIAAPIYSAIEFIQIGKLKRIPQVKGALAKAFIEYGIDLGKEVNEEGLQGVTNYIAGEIAKGNKDTEQIARGAWNSYLENVKQSFTSLAIVGGPAKAAGYIGSRTEKQQETPKQPAAVGRTAESPAPAGPTGLTLSTGPGGQAAPPAPTVETQPTQAQKEAGNYKKEHIKRDGMDISIENPAGSTRSGTDKDGKAWSQTMNHDYGYIRGTTGKDKDHVDVFIKPGSQEGGPVFVVDQVDPKTGKFDEHKAMVGFGSQDEARQAYLSNYEPGWKGLGSITEMPMEAFKEWAYSSKTKKPLGNLSEAQTSAAAPVAPGETKPPVSETITPVSGTITPIGVSETQKRVAPEGTKPAPALSNKEEWSEARAAVQKAIAGQISEEQENKVKNLIDKGYVNLTKVKRGKTDYYRIYDAVGNDQFFKADSPVIDFIKASIPKARLPYQEAGSIGQPLAQPEKDAVDDLVREGYKYTKQVMKKIGSGPKAQLKQVWKVYNDRGQAQYLPAEQTGVINYLRSKIGEKEVPAFRMAGPAVEGRKEQVGQAGPVGRVGPERKKLSREEIAALPDEEKIAYIESLQERSAKAETEAITDPLTGLTNRRGLKEKGFDVAVDPNIALDADFFKLVNDRHGHKTGDEVLKAIAGTLQKHLGADAVVARTGGEEFNIFPLNKTLTESIINKAADAQKELAAQSFDNGKLTGITFSAGTGAGIEAADKQLYAAKQSGRGRILHEGKTYGQHPLRPGVGEKAPESGPVRKPEPQNVVPVRPGTPEEAGGGKERATGTAAGTKVVRPRSPRTPRRFDDAYRLDGSVEYTPEYYRNRFYTSFAAETYGKFRNGWKDRNGVEHKGSWPGWFFDYLVLADRPGKSGQAQKHTVTGEAIKYLQDVSDRYNEGYATLQAFLDEAGIDRPEHPDDIRSWLEESMPSGEAPYQKNEWKRYHTEYIKNAGKQEERKKKEEDRDAEGQWIKNRGDELSGLIAALRDDPQGLDEQERAELLDHGNELKKFMEKDERYYASKDEKFLIDNLAKLRERKPDERKTERPEDMREAEAAAKTLAESLGNQFDFDPGLEDVQVVVPDNESRQLQTAFMEILGPGRGPYFIKLSPKTINAVGAFNGVQLDGKIFINVESTDPAINVVAHESLHAMRGMNPVVYRAFINFLDRNLTKLGERAVDAKFKTLDLENRKMALEEIAGDILADNIGDRKFWKLVYGYSPKMMRDILDAIRRTYDKLLTYAYKNKLTKKQWFTDAVAVRRELAKLVSDTIAIQQGKKTKEQVFGGEAMFMKTGGDTPIARTRRIYDIESARAVAQEYGLEFSGSRPGPGGPDYLFTHKRTGTQFAAKTREAVARAVSDIADRVAPRGTVKAGEGLRFMRISRGVNAEQYDIFGGAKTTEQLEREEQERLNRNEMARRAEERKGGEADLRGLPMFEDQDIEGSQQTLKFMREGVGQGGQVGRAGQEKADTFFSPTLKAVQGLKQVRGTGDQMFNMITKTPGVKEAEWKWMGLDDFLKGKQSVTKQEIEGFVRQNQVRVEEVEKVGESFDREKARRETEETIRNEVNDYKYADEQFWYESIKEQKNKVWDKIIDTEKDDGVIKDIWGEEVPAVTMEYDGDKIRIVKDDTYDEDEIFKEFKLDDRDFFKLIPENEIKEAQEEAINDSQHEIADAIDEMERDFNVSSGNKNSTIFSQYTLPGGENYREVLLTLPSIDKGSITDKWKAESSGYGKWDVFDENGIPIKQINAEYADEAIEKAARWNEVNLPNRFKSSHWDEPNVIAHVRLDDRTGPNGEKVLFVEEIQSDWAREARERGVGVKRTFVVRDRSDGDIEDEFDTKEAAQKYIDDSGNENLVIDINMKGETGVPAQPFLKNWEELVLKRVLRMAAEEGYDRVSWINGEQTAARYDLSKQIGKAVWNEDKKILTAYDPQMEKTVIQQNINDPKELADYIGKDAAQKLVDAEPDADGDREISGLDLKIGGEWASALYDRMIPKFLEKYSKKWNTKVEPIDFTDQEGFSTKAYGDYMDSMAEKYEYFGPWGSLMNKMNQEEKQQANELRNKQPPTDGPSVQQSIPITPEMRESVLYEGQPLFMRRQEKEKKPLSDIYAEAAAAPQPTMIQKIMGKEKSFRDRKDQVAADIMTPLSTRLRKIHQYFKDAMRKFEFNAHMAEQKDTKAVLPLLNGIKKMSATDRTIFDLALKNGDPVKSGEIIKKYHLENDYERVRGVLDGIHQRAVDVGFDVNYVKSYWPRVVLDPPGLLKNLMEQPEWGVIEQEIAKVEADLQRPLSEMEKAKIANTYIARPDRIIEKPGAIQYRVVDVIDTKIDRFYDYSPSALVQYLHEMNQAIEIRKFLGRGGKKKKAEETTEEIKSEGDKILDIEGGIGNYVMEAINAGKLNAEQQDELIGLLRARFGYKPSGGITQKIKELGYITSMGSGWSSFITQIGDLTWAYYVAGPLRATKSTFNAFAGKSKIRKEDLGLERIAEEFRSSKGLGKALEKIFNITLLTKMDNIGKEALINGARDRYRTLAQKGNPEFVKTINRIFGEEAPDVLSDLKNNIASDNVKLLLFNRLLDFQPMTLSEMPKAYLTSPRGRLLYMLKTFTIKQLDAFRNESLTVIKKGFQDKNSKEVMRGLLNLVYLAALFIMANAGADEIKDWIFGRKPSFADKVWDNILRLFGMSRFIAWETRRSGPVMAFWKLISPPMDIVEAPLKDAWAMFKDDGKPWQIKVKNAETWKVIPFIGKHYYWWFGGGREAGQRREEKAERATKSPERLHYESKLRSYKKQYEEAIKRGDKEQADKIKAKRQEYYKNNFSKVLEKEKEFREKQTR
jgi:diguanylate cyclase (GGDEF)-like protein